MKEFEELFTVDDIAQMTMLTSRTIRNYLKDGMLTGRKVGGQWRFTKKDIENLFNNNQVEEDINDNRRQEVMDFINGVNTDIEGEIQLCTIADYYCSDIQNAKDLSLRFGDIISDQTATTQLRFYYEYIEKEQKARYTFFGTPTYIKSAVQLMEEEWKKLNSSHFKFTDRADNYEKFRPSYPKAAIDHILDLSEKKTNIIADIGSGTGKLTQLLLERGQTVYAVEPNSEMRAEAEKKLGKYKNFHSLNKAAENTSIKANSVDLILCAEAYHWFDNENTRMEFKRILKPQGMVVLLWNMVGNSPYNGEIGELNSKYAKKDSLEVAVVSKEERVKHLFGEGNYKKLEFENNFLESYEAMLGGFLSASFAPQPGEENYIEYENGLKDVFDRYSRDDMIEAKFITTCFYGNL